MKTRTKRSIRILLSALLVLVMAFQSFAAPVSYAGPTAASEPAKVTGTWSLDAAGNWNFNAQDGAAKDGWYYLNTTNKATEYNWFHFTNGVMNTGWIQDKTDPSVWYYTGEIKDSSEGGMVKGWATDPRDGKRYYMDPSTGIMRYGWQLIGNVWYYFGEKQYANASHPYGAMYVNEKTPDGYYVGSNGGWIQNHSESESDEPAVVSVTGVSLEPIEVSIVVGDTFTLSAAVAPANATNKKVTWSSNNTDAATVDAAGKVTAVAAGMAIITVTTVDGGKTATCTVTVTPAPETKTIADILPGNFPTSFDTGWKNQTDKNVKLYRHDASTLMVRFDKGGMTIDTSVKLASKGKDYSCSVDGITWTFHMNEGALASVTISEASVIAFNGTYAPVVPVTGVSLNKTSMTLTVGGNETLTATIVPDGATNKNVTWTSSNKDVATVSNGVVTGMAAGTATITVTTVDGNKTANCAVTVNPAPKKVADILPGGFPAKFDSGWKNQKNTEAKLYNDGAYLRARTDKENFIFIQLSKELTSDGDNYSYSDGLSKWTFNMNNGVVASVTISSIKESLNGTYVPEGTAFKAVYDTTDDANTLTFYYDNKTYSGDNITVYDNLPTAATNPTDWGYNSVRTKIKSVVIDSSVANYQGLTSTTFMFHNMKSAGSITGAEYLDVSNVTDMSYMFNYYGYNATKLNAVPNVSGWNTSNVTNMSYMFRSYGHNSTGLNEVPNVANWKISNVRDMSNMFESYGQASEQLDKVPVVIGWITVNVESMNSMFANYGQTSTVLNAVPAVSGWNTAKVTNIINMFNCYGQTSTALNFTLDLSGWSVESVSNYAGVFGYTGDAAGNWSVTIPAKTGEQANETTKWYVGNGTDTGKFIIPAEGKEFTLPKTTADILPENFPSSKGTGWQNQENSEAKLYYRTDGSQPVLCAEYFDGTNTHTTFITMGQELNPEGSDYSYTTYGKKWIFHMNNGVLAGVEVECKDEQLNGTYKPPVSPQLLNAPLVGSEELPAEETASVETKAEGTVENVEAEKDLSIPVEALETEIPEAVVPEIAEEVKPEEAL